MAKKRPPQKPDKKRKRQKDVKSVRKATERLQELLDTRAEPQTKTGVTTILDEFIEALREIVPPQGQGHGQGPRGQGHKGNQGHR